MTENPSTLQEIPVTDITDRMEGKVKLMGSCNICMSPSDVAVIAMTIVKPVITC